MFQTLLHEMIHAYLFVTNNDKDREGHGPEFCKHMHRINRLTGANITVCEPRPRPAHSSSVPGAGLGRNDFCP